MIKYVFLGHRNNLPLRYFIFLSLFFWSFVSSAQTPANFSGTWTLDNAKSDASFKDYKIICTIKQSPESIQIEETFFEKTGEKITAPANSYTLDGKVTSKEGQGVTDKKSAKWSPDKNILTITNTRTVGNNVYGSNTSYKLSDNGLVLTVQTTDIDTSNGSTLIQVYNKNRD